MCVSDVNGKNGVDAMDAALILDFVAEKITRFPVEE